MPAGVAEPALAGGLPAHVPVVLDDDLVGQQLGDGGDVAEHVGDDPDPDLVGDVAQRVGVQQLAVDLRGRPSSANDSTLFVRPVTLR